MTKDDLQNLIHLKREFEFNYDGVNYNITYDKDSEGNDVILFGRTYQGEIYKSFGELFNNARIENHFLKDTLEYIPLK